tara:strand:- start:4986 stop:5321 length:336 start_codon:yes stop_codon:yes gene_type:complete
VGDFMEFENITKKLNEAREMAFTLRVITQMLDELQQQPALQKLADSLSDLLREINEEFEKNKENLTEKFENLVEDQLSGIEFYANMPGWQIELIESFDIDTSDLKNDTEEK